MSYYRQATRPIGHKEDKGRKGREPGRKCAAQSDTGGRLKESGSFGRERELVHERNKFLGA